MYMYVHTCTYYRHVQVCIYIYVCMLSFSIVIEFFVTDKDEAPVNSTTIYSKLTKDGQDFMLGHYHAVAVEEKGN